VPKKWVAPKKVVLGYNISSKLGKEANKLKKIKFLNMGNFVSVIQLKLVPT